MTPYDTMTQLRMRQLMQPQSVTSQQPAVITPQANDSQSQSDQIAAPDSTALQRYSQSIQQIPQPSQFQSSRLQRIAATLQSLGTNRPAGMYGGQPVGMVANPAAAQQIQSQALQAPYQRAMQAWKMQNAPLAQAAQLESARNRALVQQQQTEELRATQRDRADIARQAEENRSAYQTELNRIRDENASTRQQQEALNEWTKKNPSNKIVVTPQGVFGVNPQTNATEQLTINGKPLESGKLSDQDKKLMDLHNRLAEIGAIGTRQKDVEATKQTGRENLEDIKQGGRTDLENQKAKARLTFKTTPGAAPPNKTTTVQITDSGGKVIGGKTTTVSSMPSQVKMLAPDGKTTGTVDSKEVDRLVKAGYTVVK